MPRGGKRANAGRPRSIDEKVQVALWMRKKDRDYLKNLADEHGITLNQMILQYIPTKLDIE